MRRRYYINIITVLIASLFLLFHGNVRIFAGERISGSRISGGRMTFGRISGSGVSGSGLSGKRVSGNGVSGNGVSGNEASGNEVSGNEVSGNEVSGNEVSGNEVSGNEVSGNEVSGNEVSGNEDSGNEVSGNEVSGNETPSAGGDTGKGISVKCTGISHRGHTAVVSIAAECTGGDIALIQVENSRAGVRKTLYRPEVASKSLDFMVTANGSYVFYAYDTNGNTDSCRVNIYDLKTGSIDDYLRRAQENRKAGIRSTAAEEEEWKKRDDKPARVIFGGVSGAAGTVRKTAGSLPGKRYTVRSGNGNRNTDGQASTEKYSDWSMLKKKNRRADTKAWYEPYTDTGEPVVRPQPLENIIDLSDYETDLFKADVSPLTGDESGGSAGTGQQASDTKTEYMTAASDDDPAQGKVQKRHIALIVAAFITILLLVSAFWKAIKKHRLTAGSAVRERRLYQKNDFD